MSRQPGRRPRGTPQPGRRPKGTATSAVGLYVEVDPELKAVFDRTVQAVGQRKWVVMEEILRKLQDELGPDGRPEWWPDTDQEELPLKSA